MNWFAVSARCGKGWTVNIVGWAIVRSNSQMVRVQHQDVGWYASRSHHISTEHISRRKYTPPKEWFWYMYRYNSRRIEGYIPVVARRFKLLPCYRKRKSGRREKFWQSSRRKRVGSRSQTDVRSLLVKPSSDPGGRKESVHRPPWGNSGGCSAVEVSKLRVFNNWREVPSPPALMARLVKE